MTNVLCLDYFVTVVRAAILDVLDLDTILYTPYNLEYMETHNLAVATKLLYEAPIALFTTKALRDLWPDELPDSTFFSLLQRLEGSGVLVRLERDKYMLAGKHVHDFVLANFLYEPSYISLETALNFYGILPQFPYEISSITLKKTATKIVRGKTFRYVHIKQSLYWGYEARDGYLIAQPEKAYLDLRYLGRKGIRSWHMDEYDTSSLDENTLSAYEKLFLHVKGVGNT